MAEGAEAVKNYAVLHAENVSLKRDLQRADSLIQVYRYNQMQQSNFIGLQTDQLLTKDSLIAGYKGIINKVGTRKKTWAVSLQAGYGYYINSEVKRSPYVGIGLSRALIRF